MATWITKEHAPQTAEEILNLLATFNPGDKLRFKHPMSEGYVYLLVITRPDYEDNK